MDEDSDRSTWLKDESGQFDWLIPIKNFGKKRSAVWKHFDAFEGRGGTATEGVTTTVVRCHICSKLKSFTISSKSSTSGMIHHLRSAHNSELVDQDGGCSLEKRKASDANGNQTKLDDFSALSKKEAIDKLLFELLVVENLPFRLTEQPSFKKFCEALNPQYNVPTRRRTGETLLQNQLIEMKKVRESLFKNMDNFSISVDEWSSPSLGRSFLAVIAHGLRKDFTRYSVTLALTPFVDEEHGAQGIQKVIISALNACGLRLEDVLSIVSDGASAMKKTAKDLGLKWTHCLAHSIHLVVERVTSQTEDLKCVFDACRQNATVLARSVKAQRILRRIEAESGNAHLRMKKDSVTRWGSKVVMLRRALRNRDATNELSRTLTSGEGGQEVVEIDDLSATVAFECLEVLKIFEEATKMASSANESIASYIPVVVGVMKALETRARDRLGGRVTSALAERAHGEVRERFLGEKANILRNDHLLSATYLDPRYVNRTNIMDSDGWLIAKSALERTVMSYVSNADEQDVQFIQEQTSGTAASGTSPRTLEEFFSQEGERVADTSSNVVENKLKDEVSIYLSLVARMRANGISMETNVVTSFWRSNRTVMPILSRCARGIMGPPLGSVDVERLFSVVGRLFAGKLRNRLLDEKVSDMLLLREFTLKGKDYFKSEMIQPDGSSAVEEEEDLFQFELSS